MEPLGSIDVHKLESLVVHKDDIWSVRQVFSKQDAIAYGRLEWCTADPERQNYDSYYNAQRGDLFIFNKATKPRPQFQMFVSSVGAIELRDGGNGHVVLAKFLSDKPGINDWFERECRPRIRESQSQRLNAPRPATLADFGFFGTYSTILEINGVQFPCTEVNIDREVQEVQLFGNHLAPVSRHATLTFVMHGVSMEVVRTIQDMYYRQVQPTMDVGSTYLLNARMLRGHGQDLTEFANFFGFFFLSLDTSFPESLQHGATVTVRASYDYYQASSLDNDNRLAESHGRL